MTNFASRAGIKLDFALTEFKLDVSEKVCADLGCSTGGFTDCLLHRGAAKVYSVDTGYGVLAWKLRVDPRVVVLERTNALHVVLPELCDFVSVDVSWTRQAMVLPHALDLLKPEGVLVSLLKPHYEAPKHWLKSGQLLPEHLPEVVDQVTSQLSQIGISVSQQVTSPILGEKGGNTEYLLLIRKPGLV